MDKEKLKELQASSDAFADRMGWPRSKVNVEFHEAITKGGGRASFDLILPLRMQRVRGKLSTG